jgi:hypothetical protein
VKVILKKFKKINVTEFTSGDADKVNLKYTDSGLIKVVLLSPKMLDFRLLIFLLPNSLKELMLHYMTTMGRPPA